MNTLTIDTSTIVASVAILNEEKLVGEMIINHQKKHSEKTDDRHRSFTQ